MALKALACGFLTLIGLFQTRLCAHDPGLSTTQVILGAQAIELTVGLSPTDARCFLPASVRAGRNWTEADFTAARADLTRVGPQLWDASGTSGPVAALSSDVALSSPNSLSFRITYPLPAGRTLILTSLAMAKLPPGHRDYLTVSDGSGDRLLEKLVGAGDGPVAIDLPLAFSAPAGDSSGRVTFWGFLRLGILHIWTGYDHLLFLFGLLVVCRSFKSIAAIISCFTIAHSLTLALATLNIVNIPSRIIEPAIAASITFVGIENLVRRGAEPVGRWALTFAFGLVHGFGFASALRELGVGHNGQGLAMPLFTFNLGVEIGQISIAAVVLPIVWRLRKDKTFLRRGVPWLSALVASAGLFWFLQRTVFA